MLITTKATLLTAESKPYNFDGREGVSSRIRFLVEGDILPLKATEEDVSRMQEQKGKEGQLSFEITSRKEVVSVFFKSFDLKK